MSTRVSLSTQSIRVIRVFLASPGDLSDERKAARAAIDEINETTARPAGFHVDLIGWEDTLSGMGRPQAIINEELKSCQMFVGMLWARWGTPPDLKGKFTSGFQEEFELATELFSARGEPYIKLLFKDVEENKRSDPGPELSKVLSFKSEIIEKKTILFETFSDTAAFTRKLRLGVANFINNLREIGKDQDKQSSSRSKPDLPPQNPSHLDVDQENAQSGQNQEAEFLASIGQIFAEDQDDSLTSFDIARLRNISSTLHKSGNDHSTLSAHDANIMYIGRKNVAFSSREKSGLADAGLEFILSENIPVWSWIAEKNRELPAWLSYSTVVGPAKRRIGAFRALKIMGQNIADLTFIDSQELATYWFEEDNETTVRAAALDYIREIGSDIFKNLIEGEIARNNFATRKPAVEALIAVLSRSSVRSAAETAISLSFEELREDLFDAITPGFSEVSDDILFKALDHRAGLIRSIAIQVLSDRKKLTSEQVRRFFGDSSIRARKATARALRKLEVALTPDDLKAVLVLDKEKQKGLGLSTSYDFEGDAEYETSKRLLLSEQSFKTLSNAQKSDAFGMSDNYLALAQGHFHKVKTRLRHDIDDHFQSHWTDYISGIREQYRDQGAEAIVKIVNQHEQYHRRRLARTTLDIVTSHNDREDLPRVRKALDNDEVDPRFSDIDFLQHYGSWEDIRRITSIDGDYRSAPSAGLLSFTPRRNDKAAIAILKLAGDRIREILVTELPPSLLSSIIQRMPMTKFRRIGEAVIDKLLLHGSDQVRKSVSLQLLKCMSNREVREHLERYLKIEQARYYNVIFWLDLGEAFDKAVYTRMVEIEQRRIGD